MKKILNDYECEGQMSIFDFIPKPEPKNQWELPCDTCGHDIKGCCDYDYINNHDYCVLGDKWIPKAPEEGAAAPAEDFMNPPEEAAKAADQKPDYNLSGDPDYHGVLDEIRRLTIENNFENSITLFKCKCGKKPERLFKGCHEYFVRCPKCGRETEHFSKMYKAMQAWNNGKVQEPKEVPICKHSKHTCNKKELWKVADTLDDIQCPHVCCRMCNTRNCGARCNGSEEPKRTPQIYRYLRYGPHTLVAEVREEAKAWLDQNGVPEWVKWSKSSLPCENCTWWDGTNCCSGGHTNHYEYGYLICDGFYQSCVVRKPSTVGEGFPQGIKQEPHIYSLDIKGICDDPYCPQCGYAFETIKTCKNYEVDCERCPECHVRVDWTLWHRINDKEVT